MAGDEIEVTARLTIFAGIAALGAIAGAVGGLLVR
jgi:hypothetical protein